MAEVSGDDIIEQVADRTVSGRKVCRLIDGRRHGYPNRPGQSGMSTAAKLILGVAALATAVCPTTVASIHAVSNTPSVGFKNRRQRRVAGQRNV